MDELIARLQRATEPDRCLDRDICLTCKTYPPEGKNWQPHPSHKHILMDDDNEWIPVSRYTESIDAALELLPDEDHVWKAGYSKHVRHNAEVCDMMHPYKGVFVGEHDHSRAMAICIAALKAHKATLFGS